MFPRLLTTALLAAGLLFSTSGCIKEPEMTVGTGSYKLDGVEKNCDVQADVTNPVVQNQPYDQLDIQLLTKPEPASGPEVAFLKFTKRQGSPAADYKLVSMGYRAAGGQTTTPYVLIFGTLQEAKGSYSGTFSGVSFYASAIPPLTISDGTFEGVRP